MSSTISETIHENEYEILRFQKDIGSALIENIKKVLREDDIDFTGDLSASFSLVMLGGKAWVESNNKYAGLVDRGMNPGKFVNFDALKDWVRIKLNISDEPELTSVTWKILKKIQSKGIAPKRYAKKAIKMVIGKHGVPNIKRKSGSSKSKPNKHGKRMKKVIKTLKSINKIIKKINRKGIKFMKKSNKIINKTLDKTIKYQKRLNRV